MLVEDQSFIAMDVEEMLRELSCDEVMTASFVYDAVGLINEGIPNLAILDFNLGAHTERCYPNGRADPAMPTQVGAGIKAMAISQRPPSRSQ